MGKRLTDRGVQPDLLVSSPALRALTTAQLIADELGYKRKDIVVDERLYASSPDNLLAVICALDDRLDRVMLFGHNPEFTDLAHRLSSTIIEMPTCPHAHMRRRRVPLRRKSVGGCRGDRPGEGEDGRAEELVQTSSLRLPVPLSPRKHCQESPRRPDRSADLVSGHDAPGRFRSKDGLADITAGTGD